MNTGGHDPFRDYCHSPPPYVTINKLLLELGVIRQNMLDKRTLHSNWCLMVLTLS